MKGFARWRQRRTWLAGAALVGRSTDPWPGPRLAFGLGQLGFLGRRNLGSAFNGSLALRGVDEGLLGIVEVLGRFGLPSPWFCSES